MGYLDDLKADWQYTPGVVDLVHTGDGATVKANADSQGPSFREIGVGGMVGVEPTDAVWLLWAGTVTQTPVRADILTDGDGAVWTVLSFSPIREEGTILKWRCICRKQVT